MSFAAEDVYDLLKKLRYDLTAAQTKLTELQKAIDAMQLPTGQPKHDCPICAIAFRTERRVTEHLYVVHGQPEIIKDSEQQEVTAA